MGWKKFLLRRDVLDPTKGYLDNNGTLTVEVDIQVWTDAPPIYTPRKRLRLNMEESLESANEGDTCFTVGDKRFVVYKGLIARSAPILGEMADSERRLGAIFPSMTWTRPSLRRFFALSTPTSLLKSWTILEKY